MSEPGEALLIFAASVAVLLVLFWPQRGLFWAWLQLRQRGEQVLIEDALKHIHACSYRQVDATVQSLTGALDISAEQSVRLISRMEPLGLVALKHGRVTLTAEGRTQVLHVIRVHRLWERYLAEYTSVPQLDWHREAEQREHTLTAAETEALDARLNYPRYDPHGDPIPTADGEVAPSEGDPLADISPGNWVRIVHIEDEPDVIYRQIVACGLQPGMVLQVIETTPERVRFFGSGEEYVLAPIVATNVTVAAIIEPQKKYASGRQSLRLTALKLGECAKVIGIASGCIGLKRERLLDLGVIYGTEIEVEMGSPLGDPTAYRIRGATIALRREQAAQIQIERQPTTEVVTV